MEATQQLTISLEARQWNDVMDALHNAPFRVSAPIIQEIVRQHNEAEMKARSAAKEPASDIALAAPKSNGAVSPDHQMR